MIASSNQLEHEVEVSLASSVEEAFEAGMVSSDRPFPLPDHLELEGELGWAVPPGDRCDVERELEELGDLLEWASFFRRFSFARRF